MGENCASVPVSHYSLGGFCLACDDLGRMFNQSFPACALFVCFFLSGEWLIPLFMPGLVLDGSMS